MDAIISRLSAFTITNLDTTPPEVGCIETTEQALNQLTNNNIAPLPLPLPSPPTSPDPSTTASILDGDLRRLWLLDEKFDSHMKSIILSLDALSSPGISSQCQVEASLAQEKRWLESSIRELYGLQHHCEADIRVLAAAMRDRMAQFASGIDMYLEVLQRRSSPQSSPHVINSGKFILILSSQNSQLPLDPYFITDLHGKHTPSLVAILNVVAQNLFGHATRTWCNANLQSHKLFWEELMTEGGRTPSVRDTKLHTNFPTDLRTARKSLNIEPDTIKYAACPTCCCLYPPGNTGTATEWPTECTWRSFKDSPPCGQPLVKSAVKDGESVRAPIYPYVVQNFDSFVGRMLCRPGYEKILDDGTVFSDHDKELWDIKDAEAIRGLKGPDNKPFMDGFKRNELRLAWSLSVDWFNPFHNKKGGKSASSGSIAMLLLNLPPSLRYQSENIYLHSVSPREPTADRVNHYLEPLVQTMEHNHQHGTHFTKTYDNPHEGRNTRSMIAVEVFDLKGAKRVLGHCSPTSNHNFCSFCTTSKANIGNFDWQQWEPRKVEDLRSAAEKWRDAPSAAERKALYKANGVRWSALWGLSYFDPTRSVIVDGMHNLFEGLVEFHCRTVLGIDRPPPEPEEEKVADPEQLATATRLFAQSPPRDRLERFTIPVLKALCSNNHIPLPNVARGKKLKKAQVLDVLKDFLVGPLMLSSTTPLNIPQEKRALQIPAPSNSPNLAGSAFESLVGNEYIDELVTPSNTGAPTRRAREWVVGDDGVTAKELKHIHKFLSETTRPSWHTPPPKNLGEASHGTLKADQLRSSIEFDVPAAIAQIWDHKCQESGNERELRQKKLVHATMLLAMAICWATSYRTSTLHAAQYMKCMVEYLNTLKELYPNLPWRPNHHTALHIGPFLLLFGPMHGWWMFVFERLIGKLQKINTNYKLGELGAVILC